jgi:hypothetical protein
MGSSFPARSSVDAKLVSVLVNVEGAKRCRNVLTEFATKEMGTVFGVGAVTSFGDFSSGFVLEFNTLAAVLAREPCFFSANGLAVNRELVLAIHTRRAIWALAVLVIVLLKEAILVEHEDGLMEVLKPWPANSAVLAFHIAVVSVNGSRKLTMRSVKTVGTLARICVRKIISCPAFTAVETE